jgi:hypothetical protein
MILANVCDAQTKVGGGLGEYEFLQLPSPGDQILLPQLSGNLGLWRVLYTEHSPKKIPQRPSARPTALATIFVEWIDDVTP